MKKQQKAWSSEARERHIAGCRRYQKERKERETYFNAWHIITEAAENFSGRHGYDYDCTLAALREIIINWEPLNGDLDFTASRLHALTRQKQAEKGIVSAVA